MLTCPPVYLARRRRMTRSSMLIVGTSLGVMLAVGVALVSEVQALSVGVADLRVAQIGALEPSTVFPARTEAIDALFEFVDAEGEEIELVIKGRGGIECFRHMATYDGSGSARVMIRGATMYPVIAETLAAAVLEAKRNAKSAASRTFGVKEFLLSAQAGAMRSGYAAETLLAADLPSDLKSRAEDVLGVVEAASAELDAAIALPETDLSGMQSIAAAVDVVLSEAVLASRDLRSAAPRITSMALPSTGEGTLLIQALVAGSVAASAEFRVEVVREMEKLYLPKVAAE